MTGILKRLFVFLTFIGDDAACACFWQYTYTVFVINVDVALSFGWGLSVCTSRQAH